MAQWNNYRMSVAYNKYIMIATETIGTCQFHNIKHTVFCSVLAKLEEHVLQVICPKKEFYYYY
jgi:hypothetical protein